MAKRKAKSAGKKQTPFPTEAQIVEFVQAQPGHVGKREIARAFGIRGPDRVQLKQLLKRMAEDGLIAGTRKRVHQPGALPPVAVLNVVSLDENGEPIAVPASWDEAELGPPPAVLVTGDAAPRAAKPAPAPGIGERVLARIKHSSPHEAHGHDYEGRIIKRLPKRTREVFGIFRADPGGGGRLEPIDKKIRSAFIVAPGTENNAVDGELVAAEMVSQRAFGLSAAKVSERIGPIDSHKALSTIAIAEHGLPHRFPADVLEACDALAPPDLSAHEDLTKIPFVTIDPEDARDHDDAVWAEPVGSPDKPDGWAVMVAIADVALHVHAGSPIDREARSRGNSAYFPDRVVPMLPERLSTDLCSLRADEVRPVMVARMRFDKDGTKTGHAFVRARIRSCAKLTYAQAQAAIDGGADDTTKPLLTPVLEPLWGAYRALAKARDQRAPLDLDLPERRIQFDETGRMTGVTVPPRLDAHRLIEEFMIQANVAAAETLAKAGSPLIHRFHDVPSPEKVAALNDFLGTLDLKFPKSGTIRPEMFNRLIERVRGRGVEHLLSQVVLRSQAQAIYSATESGHFGLNLPRYVHFTSPIRRYADLVVHRALIAALDLGPGGLSEAEAAQIGETAAHISTTERRAMAAERDTVDRMSAAFLSGEVGTVFAGRISGLAGAGLFIELTETGADGFVPVSSLEQDYFFHDERAHKLRGERTGETFSLGDEVKVRLIAAHAASGALKLEMLSEGKIEPVKRRPARSRPRQRGRRQARR